MANEYLKRTPTSTGNRKVFTFALWLKRNIVENDTGADAVFNAADTSSQSHGTDIRFRKDNSGGSNFWNFYDYVSGAFVWRYYGSVQYRDSGNWFHAMFVFDSTNAVAQNRVRVYINGVLDNNYAAASDPSQNYETYVNSITEHYLGVDQFAGSLTTSYSKSQFADVFLVDGQALTPDVFGFYKDGDGYQSSGTSQATDFRPGQWMPHSPTKIKKDVNRRGGFGVNGFYLPMNDSSNPGADFHCAPNSIITLKGEDLPQPRNGAPTTTDAYVSQLRSDPFAANLVLAIPFITGGRDSGAGDYSADIKGSGTNKTVTVNGTFSVGDCSSYYGSALKGSSGNRHVAVSAHSDFANLYDVDHTIEFWYKNDSWNGGYLPHQDIIANRHSTNNVAWRISFTDKNNTEDGIQLFGSNGFSSGANTLNNDWNHCAVEQQNGATTIYINGVAAGRNGNKHGYQTYKASTGPIIIGSDGRSANLGDTYSFNGQIQDVRIYKGVAKYKGGFDVPKPYTPVGIEAFRTTADTCKNNFATLNSIDNNGGVLSNGNLTYGDAGSDGWNNSRATIGASSGKWYWEMRVDAINQVICASVAGPAGNDSTNGARLGFLPGQSDDAGVTYYDDGRLYHADSQTGGQAGWGAAYGATDVIGIALDMDDSGGKVWFSKNGSWQASGNPSTGANAARSDLKTYADTYFPTSGTYFANTTQTFNFGQNPSFSGTVTAGTNADDSGKGLFKYAPPTGFLALCEDNLPAPAIADPGKHFKTVLYTGDGNDGRSITGVGFKPDFIWQKERSSTSWHNLVDSVRGPTQRLYSNETNAESTTTNSFRSFDSDGFSIGDDGGTNQSGVTNVAWCWKAGGAAVTNNDGDLTSQVSVNQTAGFSIITWLSNAVGSIQTLGHGLGKTPDFIIVKNRDYAYDWFVWHKDLANTTRGYLRLNTTNSETTGGNDTWSVSSTTFGLRQSSMANANTDDFVAYCWAEIENFSKFGSFTGNNDADGPFVYCGFKPAFVIIKTRSGGSWVIKDSSRKPSNPNNSQLYANTAAVDDDPYGAMDFLSNGFKPRVVSQSINASETYIFAAFAESPFQTANAK